MPLQVKGSELESQSYFIHLKTSFSTFLNFFSYFGMAQE